MSLPVIIIVMALNPPPPLVLIVLVCLGGMCLGNVLGKALAPLNCRGIAEPELLQQFICIMCAQAADVGCLLFAFAKEAPSLSVMSPLAVLEAMCLPYLRHCGGGNGDGHLVHDGSLHCAHTLLVLDEIVRRPSKEFGVACCPVVCMNHLLEK